MRVLVETIKQGNCRGTLLWKGMLLGTYPHDEVACVVILDGETAAEIYHPSRVSEDIESLI